MNEQQCQHWQSDLDEIDGSKRTKKKQQQQQQHRLSFKDEWEEKFYLLDVTSISELIW